MEKTKKKSAKKTTRKTAKKQTPLKLDMSFEDVIKLSAQTKMPKNNKRKKE